jgi:hypothetical protein
LKNVVQPESFNETLGSKGVLLTQTQVIQRAAWRPTAAGLLALLCLLAVSSGSAVAETVEQDEPPVLKPADLRPPESAAEEIDVTADKADAPAGKPKPSPLLEDLKGEDPLNHNARHCYAVLAEIKTNLEQIGRDLDDNGKEITRLSRTSEALCNNINELVAIWPDHELFRDTCGSAKRQALLLNQELDRVPRVWSHVRWTYNNAIKDVRKMRTYAKELADAEPKPVAVKGKDGKVAYEDRAAPALPPKEAKKQAQLRENEEVKARARKAQEARKNRKMQTELDLPKE